MREPDVSVGPVTEAGAARAPAAALVAAELQDRLDAVLAGLDGLEERPVEEHVPLLEAAHTVLREALEGPLPRPTSSTG